MRSRFHVWATLFCFVGAATAATTAGAAAAQLKRLTSCAAGGAIEKVRSLDASIDGSETARSNYYNAERERLCKSGNERRLTILKGNAAGEEKELQRMEKEAEVVAKGMKVLGADACAQQAQKLVADLRQWNKEFKEKQCQ